MHCTHDNRDAVKHMYATGVLSLKVRASSVCLDGEFWILLKACSVGLAVGEVMGERSEQQVFT